MAEVYHDRKMIKWLPFQALPEQGTFLKAVFEAEKQRERPVLSEDQEAELNYRFQEAYAFGEVVRITYFDAGKHSFCEGVIQGFDPVLKCVLMSERVIAVDDILAID